MGVLEWDPSLETGDESIDSQHRTLVELFNDLMRAETHDGPDSVREALARLTDYASVHFAMEEDLMRRVELPGPAVDEHVAEHRALTEKVRQQVIEYRTGELGSIEPLARFLGDWLSHHVRQVDAVVVSHIRAQAAEEK